ncbi:MAG: TolB family protein, partial [Gemmatimonadaceae bacterium]
AQYAVSDNGTVVYIPASAAHLVRVSRAGVSQVLLDELRRYHSPRISPDGRRIAFDDIGDGRDIWIFTEGNTGTTRATFQKDAHDPVWSLDGKGMYYLAGRNNKLDIFHTVLGTTTPPGAEGTGGEFSYTGTPLKDGGFLSVVPGGAGRGLDIVRRKPGSPELDTLLATDADESFVVPSPDNKWFAYMSDHSGRPEVYIRSLTGGEVQLQVSLEGASEPVWSRNGNDVFYRKATSAGAELVAATLDLGASPHVVKRTSLFDVSGFDSGTPHANYDVSPDGHWFAFARRGGSDHIVVLQNVPEMARRLASAGGAR